MSRSRIRTRGRNGALTKAFFLLLAAAASLLHGADARPGTPVRFRHLTVENGLPAPSARALLQDRSGFLWFGMEGGLCRYDGVRFELYQHEEGDPATLPSNVVSALSTDSIGTIWIGTGRGLSRLDAAANRMEHVVGPSAAIQADVGWITSLACDRRGTLWVGTVQGLLSLEPRTMKHVWYRHRAGDPATITSDSIYAVTVDPRGFVWLGSDSGLDEFDPRRGALARHYAAGEARTSWLSSNIVHALLADARGRLWVGTYDGLDLFETGTHRYVRSYLREPYRGVEPLNYVSSLCEDGSGGVWAGSPNGLYHCSQRDASVVHHQADGLNPKSLLSNQVISLLLDDGGTLWVGTRKGLSIYSPYGNKFSVSSHEPGNPLSLKNDRVWSFCLDRRDRLWVGTTDGVDRLDRRSRAFDHLADLPRFPWGITEEFVQPILEDRAGDLWFGTWRSGLVLLGRDGSYSRYTIGPSAIDYRGILSLLEDRRGTFWVGTRRGLFIFDRARKQFQSPALLADSETVRQAHIGCMAEDPRGGVWFGTTDAVIKFDPSTGRAERYPSSAVSVLCPLSADSATMAVGTEHGLDLVDMADPSRRTSHVGTKDGLPSDWILSVLEDSAGNLWISTPRGLARLAREGRSVRVYDVHDGLPGNVFLDCSALESPAGEMFFGGNNGFVSFYPRDLKDNPHVPRVVISKFKVLEPGGKEGRLFSDTSSRLELDYAHNTFSFEFAALDFSMPERNRYAIMLEGFEKEWRSVAPGQHSEMYTNLDPGEYVLRVKGSNGDGVWNHEGATRAIVIRPPYWMTWYFRTGAALAALLLVGSLYSVRMNAVAKRNQELEQKVLERTRELHASNQELSLYKSTLEEQVRQRTLELERTVMSLQAEVASRERIQRELISYQKDLQRLASDLSRSEERERRRIAAFLHDVVGQTLFFCKMKLGSMAAGPHAAEIEKVHALVQELLNQVQSHTFDLSPPVLYELGLDEAIIWLIEQLSRTHPAQIVYTRESLPEKLSDDIRFVVFTAARELLTNALKHSGASRIELSLGIGEGGIIRLTVRDDGRGFDAGEVLGGSPGRKSSSGGFGLFNVKERLTFMGGMLRIETAPGLGTSAELVLPLHIES